MAQTAIIISASDGETCRLGLSRAVYHLMQNERVRVFFTGDACRWLKAGRKAQELKDFLSRGGGTAACKSRENLKNSLMIFLSGANAEKIITDAAFNGRFNSFKGKGVYIKMFR